jgi:hemerythrin HHE cation binding domain-containing protein
VIEWVSTMDDRLAAFGTQLIETHDRIRDELDRLRSGEVPARDLRTHCLAFCAAITRHHTGEDDGVFPLLAQAHPSLRPVLAELRRDHEIVADVLRRIAELPADGAFQSELDTLAALLETHLTYEERKLTAILDAVPRATAMKDAFRTVNVSKDAFMA